MSRWAWMTCVIVLASTGAATPALADKVTLANGDVIHGDVKEVGGRVHITHPILGKVDLARNEVMWITKDGEAPPAPASVPATSLAARCGACQAAVKDEVETCPSPWDFRIGFGISDENGNTDKFGINADLEAAYTWGLNELRWRVNSFYEEAQGKQTEGKYFSNLQYTRQVSSRGSLIGLWIVDRDDFADIELRNGLFVGYQYAFIKRKNTTFSGALGAGWITEKRSSFEVINTSALLAQLHYKHKFQSGDSLESSWYVIPYLDYTERSPMRFEVRYAHPLRDHFDVVAGLLVDYVPDPPGDIKSYDTKLTFGVRWTP